MNIKQVQAFQCEDGTLHITSADAVTHNFRHKLVHEFAACVSLDSNQALRLADVAIQTLGCCGVDIAHTYDMFKDEILDLLREGNKIPAIKRYRELTRVGLKEAKNAVEQMGLHAGILTECVDSRTGEVYIRYPHDRF
ncbi:MAG: ribosomal protein L7/L12 [Eubacteriales bacterium]|nr:ribosomal protein L7/L12 [Eubacteriales bacterium]